MVILGVGAFAVDMGQVYAKRSALQSNVDLAVLAAAAKIDGSSTCTSDAVNVATDYLTDGGAVDGNEVADQIPVNLGGSPGDDDGYIKCTGWRVELWAPKATVDFGLAKALSPANAGVDVPAFAAAEIKSPSGGSSLPMYAVSGCNSGAQTISDPPPGPAPSAPVPDLVPDSSPDFNNADFTISPSEVPSASTPPVPMTLSGSQLRDVTAVGFTNANGEHYEVLPVDLTVTSTRVVLVSIPWQVLASDGIWWVRVKKSDARYPSGLWSDEQEAQPLTVGDRLFCDGAVSGNFGTLRISRSTGPASQWLSRNIMDGLEPTLELYPVTGATSCDDGVSPAVTSEASPPNDGTNCLGTDPGFANSAATDGLVTGEGSDQGRLDADTTPGCSRTGDDARTASTPTHPGVQLNDDWLTCFFVDDSITIQDAMDGEPGILSADIFNSPRFFQIPVLPTEAENGSSNFYPIVGFQPGFITDQPVTASAAAPGTPSAYNGLEFQTGHVEELNVVLFDPAALPESAPAVGGEIAYTGSGTKVIVLVD